jgi:5'-3' exonuclease
MGIERFFSSIEKNEITNLDSKFSKTQRDKIYTNHIFIDFNSIIHVTSYKVLNELNNDIYNCIKNEKKYKKITKNEIEEKIIDRILKETLNVLENYITGNELETLYIAIDGVPTKSKMIEQRKRRFMGSILVDIKKLIYNKHKTNLSKTRREFEDNKIEWSKNQIGPGTLFMNILHKRLTNKDFKNRIEKICPKLSKYICSGPNEPGEGETKIVNYLRSKEFLTSSYVIYSPDSDVTLLALLLNNSFSKENLMKIETLKLLRHNQQKNSYDIIDIDKLGDNIYKYITKISSRQLEKSHVIDDIVFILTVFGNDFLPKIESLNVRYDFNKLIDKYVYSIQNFPDEYIIEYSSINNRKIINYNVFINFIKIIHIEEGNSLRKNYMSSHYKNYNKLKNILGASYDNFTKVMNEFLSTYREFNKDIKNKELNKDSIITKWDKRDEFIMKLSKLSVINVKESDKFIKEYIKYFDKKNRFPKIRITFRKYSKSLDDPYHENNLHNLLKHGKKVTKYDKELYRLEHMLDEYQNKLNAYELELGQISIDIKSLNWKTEKIEKSVHNYYKKFFGIKTVDINNKHMNKLLNEYILGLVWVFEHYYNNFDPKKYTSVWAYPYQRAPLLTQIYYYLRENKDNKNLLETMSDKIEKSYIDQSKYFNSLEHLLYVSPKNALLKILPKDKHSILDNDKYFVDTNNISTKIYKHDKNNVIDCRGIIFLNKCQLNETVLPYINDDKFIDIVRNDKN